MLFDFPYSGVKSGFTFALQFFMLISDDLGGVQHSSIIAWHPPTCILHDYSIWHGKYFGTDYVWLCGSQDLRML